MGILKVSKVTVNGSNEEKWWSTVARRWFALSSRSGLAEREITSDFLSGNIFVK